MISPQTVSLLTRDRTRLDADVYYPSGSGPFPVLLMRQPYGRAIASTVVYAHPSWYASQGYIVVIQDVRGRGSSGGEFQLFAQETADAEETIAWAASLPKSNGKVGMYGFSYQGMTQLYAAASRHPALKTICPAMVGLDLYADWAYEGGAFLWQNNLAWALQIATETAKLKDDPTAYQALVQAAQQLPLEAPVPEVLATHAADSFYHDWLRCDRPGPYWQQLTPDLSGVDLPMLHIGGWFDPYLRGNLRLYHQMTQQSQQPQHLHIAPWPHIPWGRCLGNQDYGPGAANTVDTLQIHWFNYHLKGIDHQFPPAVQLFEMGSNRWRGWAKFPEPHPVVYFLASHGLAATDEASGQLTLRPPTSNHTDVFVHDPWRPVPALGGHAGFSVGQADRTALDCRSDILTYTSTPLDHALHLTGEIVVELAITADQPSFDLCAVFSTINPAGRVISICQGYRRIDTIQNLHQVRLQATCVRIPPGDRLRLSISAACFPAYALNCGTGKPFGESRAQDRRVITLWVNSDGASRVILPMVN